MNSTASIISFFFLIGATVLIFFEIARLFFLILMTKILAHRAKKFSKTGGSFSKKVLFVGDSVGFGTGALNPKKSIAGRFSEKNSNVEVLNSSVNGARIKNIISQLDQNSNISFDSMFIIAGGMDIVLFTNLKKLRKHMEICLDMAARISKNVILVLPNNTGLAPMFHFPLNLIYEKRARIVRNLFKKIAEEKGIACADIFREKENDMFSQKSKKFYAHDKTHPNDEGYELWFNVIESEYNKISQKTA